MGVRVARQCHGGVLFGIAGPVTEQTDGMHLIRMAIDAVAAPAAGNNSMNEQVMWMGCSGCTRVIDEAVLVHSSRPSSLEYQYIVALLADIEIEDVWHIQLVANPLSVPLQVVCIASSNVLINRYTAWMVSQKPVTAVRSVSVTASLPN